MQELRALLRSYGNTFQYRLRSSAIIAVAVLSITNNVLASTAADISHVSCHSSLGNYLSQGLNRQVGDTSPYHSLTLKKANRKRTLADYIDFLFRSIAIQRTVGNENGQCFERYTETARKVIVSSKHKAAYLGSLEIDTQHLLLGLLVKDKGLSRRFLGSPWAADSVWRKIEQSP